MSEYVNLGHIKVASLDQIYKEKYFYRSHHIVIKEDSSTTKLRVVIDASTKNPNRMSFKNKLHLGPRLQLEIFSTLLKLRYFTIAVWGEIEKKGTVKLQ